MRRVLDRHPRLPQAVAIGALSFALTLLLIVGASRAEAQEPASWRLEQPPPPPGAQFKVPLGPPGDLQFYSRNRGILSIEGNASVPRGLYAWNGESWHQLATVCGGQGDTARIALASPTEFWVISSPSQPRIGNGTALCHFKDGRVADSFSTPEESRDPYRQMDAAACNGPNDCWFGGFGAESPTGERRGAFHLHWDGSRLSTVYAPQGRGVSDIEFHRGQFFETTFRGARPESDETPDLAQPEPSPRLIHRFVNGSWQNDAFTPSSDPDGTELLGADSDGDDLWAVGGGAASGSRTRTDGGAAAGSSGNFPRRPLAAVLAGDTFTEIALPATEFTDEERFADVAAVPGSADAWIAVQRFDQRRTANAKARVVRVSPAGLLESDTLPASGAGRGSAAHVAFPAANDGWLVTQAGWLFHYTDGSSPGVDTEPAFQGTIDFRPNEAAEQFVPDAPPADDSLLFAPPPVEVTQVAPEQPPAVTLPALLKSVKSKLRGRTLYVSFKLTRTARVQLIGRRKKKVVAKSANKLLHKGKHTLKLKLNRRHWPTRLQFKTKDSAATSDSGDDSDTITTPQPGTSGTGTTGSGDTGTSSGTTAAGARR